MRLLLAAFLILGLTLGPAPTRAEQPAASDPRTLFAGPSTGKGTLRLGLGRERAFRVQSQGRMLPDGSFRLDQVMKFEGEPPRTRHWIIRSSGHGRFVFTLSDAAGPGVASIEKGRFLLRYPLGNGLTMQQVLEPDADGRSIDNRGSIRWLGIPVGQLVETIERGEPTR